MILARALPIETAHVILKVNVLTKAELMPGAVLRSVTFLLLNIITFYHVNNFIFYFAGIRRLLRL